MNDQERLTAFLERLKSVGGLDERSFERLVAELQRTGNRAGYDDQGRLQVAMFDAKSYDVESFDRHNNDHFAIHWIEASLSQDTVRAAENCKAVCIFVNDQCDASIVTTLAAQGVELIALRCAGFNNVDLHACQQHGLSVVRVPAYSPYAVAEHTVALMLMLNRHLHQAYQRNRAGYFVLGGLDWFRHAGQDRRSRWHGKDWPLHDRYSVGVRLSDPGVRPVSRR